MKLYWIQLNRPRSIIYLMGSLCLIGGLILLCQLSGIMLCPLHRYTGIPCFTCGSTRAVIALVYGDFRTAFLTQPLVISLLFCIMPIGITSLYTALWQRRLFMVSLSRAEKIIICLVLAVATLINWIYLLSTNAVL